MTNPRPLVNVLIDTYNHERFIEKAIVSVFEQDVPPAEMEVIVVEDAPTDETPAIIRKFAYIRRYWYGDLFWARLAHVRIVADMSPQETDRFWTSTPLVQRKVIAAFAQTGAKAIITSTVPPSVAARPGSGWAPQNTVLIRFNKCLAQIYRP